MQQHALRNVFKHHLLSETKNEELIQKRECSTRKHIIDDRKFDPSDPFPRYKLTRRVTTEFIEIENKTCVLSRCDYGHVKRESQTCRHIKHTMNQIATLEDFHPRCFKSYSQLMCQNDERVEVVENTTNFSMIMMELCLTLHLSRGK